MKIKPCPFCGAKLVKDSRSLSLYEHPYGDKPCILQLFTLDTHDDVVLWNTREAAQAAKEKDNG